MKLCANTYFHEKLNTTLGLSYSCTARQELHFIINIISLLALVFGAPLHEAKKELVFPLFWPQFMIDVSLFSTRFELFYISSEASIFLLSYNSDDLAHIFVVCFADK